MKERAEWSTGLLWVKGILGMQQSFPKKKVLLVEVEGGVKIFEFLYMKVLQGVRDSRSIVG